MWSENVWSRVCSGYGGIVSFSCNDGGDSSGSRAHEDAKRVEGDCDIHVGGFVPRGADRNDRFDMNSVFGRNVDKEVAVFSQYAVHAADLAMKNANLISSSSSSIIDPSRFGVSMASGIGAIEDILDAGYAVKKSYRKLSLYFVPKILLNMAGRQRQ